MQCDKLQTQEEISECKERNKAYFNIRTNAKSLFNSVNANIKRLLEYKNYPQKLYEYMHIIDRYLTELICILEAYLNSTI